jgi:hypothetical protein
MQVCPVFIDETGILSGRPQEQPVYGIGMLVVPDPRVITNTLYRLHFNFGAGQQRRRRQLREEIKSRPTSMTLNEVDRLMHSTSHHEYKFNAVTRFNLQQHIDLLNLYFEFPDLQFHAVLLDRLESEYNLSHWDDDEWRAYADLTRQLLTDRLDRDAFAIVDFQDKPNNSNLYLEDMICQAPKVKGCLRATSEMSVYLQLVDVLLGCVQFDWRDAKCLYGETSKRANEKRQVVDFVKDQLGLRKDERLLTSQEGCREWQMPSRFTVCLGSWKDGIPRN